MKSKEFDRIANKLDLKIRDTHHRLAWFEHDGKVIVRTRRSQGQGDLPMHNSIRQQLKLNEDQLRGIIRCNLNRTDYIEILRKKNLL